jgi:hypothetical protein
MNPGTLKLRLLLSLSILLFLLATASVFFPRPGSAGMTREWVNFVTGVDDSGDLTYSQFYGYYADVGGDTSNVFIECSPSTGDITGYAYVSGQRVGSIIHKVPVVTQVLDPTQKHTLYATENFPSVLWKGSVNLQPYWAASNQLSVTCPYQSLPGDWKWMVYQFQNNNNWPIVAKIRVTLSSAGETWEGHEPFGANETKYLRLQMNSSIGPSSSVGNNFWTWANIHQNLDPLAPPVSVLLRDVINDPRADDGTGICWSADMWEGLTFNQEASNYYTSNAFWSLRPGFRQVPAWVPNPGEDAHWGTIRWDSVPGYVWVRQTGFVPFSKGSTPLVDARNMPGVPCVVPGSYGPFQISTPSGPFVTAYSWNKVTWQYTGVEGSYRFQPASYNWLPYIQQHWPGYVNIRGNPTNADYDGASGSFFISAGSQNIIQWSVRYSGGLYIQWYEYAPVCISGMDYGGNITFPGVPADGQWHIIYSGSYISEKRQVTRGYLPIYGSYEQISSTNGSSSAAYTQNIQVYNPGPATITFNLTQGVQDGDRYFKDYFTTPGASQGQVNIPPVSSVWLTSSYSLPQESYANGGRSLAAQTWYYRKGSSYDLSPDFSTGSMRPIDSDRIFAWTASGIRNNCVAYDWGYFVSKGYLFTVGSNNANPGFSGGLLSYETAMTTVDLVKFIGNTGGVATKIQSFLNNGYTTWTARSIPYYVNHDGDSSYVSAS